ncbi:hypothetical protein ACHZIB_004182 [Yersinia enterocolitica]
MLSALFCRPFHNLKSPDYMSGLVIFEAGYGSGVNTYERADRIPLNVILWWWGIRRRRFTGVPLVSPHIGACFHHIRLSTKPLVEQ